MSKGILNLVGGQVSTKASVEKALSLKQRMVAWSAAILLVAAAVLKAWPMLTGQAVESQAASLGKLILIQGEILLALWLVSEVATAWAFRVAIVFFAGAGVVNLRSIWLGEASCGCFGTLEVPPWVSLGINSALVLTLYVLRPRASSLRSLAKSTGWLVVICFLIMSTALITSYSRHALRASVIEAPKELDLGLLDAEKQTPFAVKLTNKTSASVRIIGAQTSCRCSMVKGIPITIPPGESINLPLLINPPAQTRIEGRVVLFVDNGETTTVIVPFFGSIRQRTNIVDFAKRTRD